MMWDERRARRENERCGACVKPLLKTSASMYFCNDACQQLWHHRRTNGEGT